MKGTPKRKQRTIKVYVLPGEYDAIAANAHMANMSLSVFLRTLGAGIRIRPAIDPASIHELSHIAGDLGRLGGLLKLWLTDEVKRDGRQMDIRRVLHSIESCGRILKDRIKKIY